MATMNEKIKCMICGGETHTIANHLKRDHKEITIEQYELTYPSAPLLSPFAVEQMEELMRKKKEDSIESEVEGIFSEHATSAVVPIRHAANDKQKLSTVFGISEALGKSARGNDITVSTVVSPSDTDMIPLISTAYVYDVEDLKNAMLAIEMNIPLLVWGHAGTGKTELIEQIAARTNRPMIRVQHSANTEESHVLGQWTARGGETLFELGPLALAMKHGWLYLADEYDFAMPSVLAVYQPVMEGKSLVIKEADHSNRIIKPHPNFRFVATGNTNGSGDETGLYAGTSIQNSANYDRFGITINKKYMIEEFEMKILVNQASVNSADAANLVKFANRVREAYSGGTISNTISPRALINIARIGIARANYITGVNLAFSNKMTAVDKEAVNGFAQRVFGSGV